MVFVPVETYMAYGDISSLRMSYETLLKFANFVRRLPLVDGLSSGHMSWNDWFSEPSNADRVLLENLSVCLLFRKLAWIANELGETGEARSLTMDAGVRSDAINKKFFRDGNYGGINMQTEMSLALAAGVVPQADEMAVAKTLFDDIEKHGFLTLGIYGVWALMTDVLPRFGRNDLAWKMVKGEKPRTFGFWLVDPNEPQGLTSIPERWITDRTHPGIQTSHMDFTSFDAWFHREFAGLKPTKPGYKEFLFAPFLSEGVESAATTKETPYGLLSVSWKRKGNDLLVELDVPVSVEGVLRIPGAGEDQRVGSGKHEFRMILAFGSSCGKSGGLA